MDKIIKENINYQNRSAQTNRKYSEEIETAVKDPPTLCLSLPAPRTQPFVVTQAGSAESQGESAQSRLLCQSTEKYGDPPTLFYKASLFLILGEYNYRLISLTTIEAKTLQCTKYLNTVVY